MINRFKRYYNIDNDDVTPPDPDPTTCYSFIFEATTEEAVTFTFTKCKNGATGTVTVPGNSSVEMCGRLAFNPPVASSKWLIHLNGLCV